MSLPLEHLSASSFSLFMRCPRQWQRKYIHGIREPSNSSLIIGSAVHAELAGRFGGKVNQGTFVDSVMDAGGWDEIEWRDSPEKSMEIFNGHVDEYWERVGKHLLPSVVAAEQELLFEVPGVGLPILGYVDLETTTKILDYKTTAYRSRNVKANKEWIFQLRLYQLAIPKPGEIHVLTRFAGDPVIVPSSQEHSLYVPVVDSEPMVKQLSGTYRTMVRMFEEFGDGEDWPGNPLHEWAGKYCQVPNCCEMRR